MRTTIHVAICLHCRRKTQRYEKYIVKYIQEQVRLEKEQERLRKELERTRIEKEMIEKVLGTYFPDTAK